MKDSMKEASVMLNFELPLAMFEQPVIRKASHQVINLAMFYERYNEILSYVKDSKDSLELSYHHILFLFKVFFYKEIATTAIMKSFSEENCYDIRENILSLLTKDNFSDALSGKPMLNAFTSALNDLSKHSTLTTLYVKDILALLRRECFDLDFHL